MSVNLKIRRQESAQTQPYFQTFRYDGLVEVTVADAIEQLNSREFIIDIDGRLAARIQWECGCLQKKCGACAMVIEGLPRLACSVFVSDLTTEKDTVTIEPMSKFPVVQDLIVDRRAMYEHVKQMKLWLETEARDCGEDAFLHSQASRCLMCGCCVDICPSYGARGAFAGSAAVAAASKLMDQSKGSDHCRVITSQYNQHFVGACGQSPSCESICPVGIPLEELMARANRKALFV